MVWKRGGSPRHAGCGEGQSGVERRNFYAILFLASGFGKIRLRRAEKFFDENSRRRRPKVKCVSLTTRKHVSNTRRFELSERAIGLAVPYPPSFPAGQRH